MVIIVGNGLSESGLNPKRDCLDFISFYSPLEKKTSMYHFNSSLIVKQTGVFKFDTKHLEKE